MSKLLVRGQVYIAGNFEGLNFRGFGKNGFSRGYIFADVPEIATPIHQQELRGVKISRIKANLRKPQKFHPSKITRYTVSILGVIIPYFF